MKYSFLVLMALLMYGCQKNNHPMEEPMEEPMDASDLYFPPITSNDWERTSPEEEGWDTTQLVSLKAFLEENNTRAFIILKDGKIVVEEYWGNNIFSTWSFDKDSQWYWASAGKSLTASLVGIAQQEGDLDIEQSTSEYLGEGWTSMTPEKEKLIKVKHQLTMTTGLDYEVADIGCTEPECLTYKTDAGAQWYYHNAPYTLLEKVMENATGIDYNDFTDQKLESKIGMNGDWRPLGSNIVYWSTARDMARYGLLMLNKGTWGETVVLSDTSYYNEMVNTSQDLNPSYGYLWWLNGKSSIILPSFSDSVDAPLSQSAPADLYAGMGKNGQFVEVVPSKNLVVIRMGESPDNSLVPIIFHDDMWARISKVID